jgi:anaerobic selenocysteine-containing dehydrogenase
MCRVGGRYVEGTYEEAIADIARRLNEVIERCGPDAAGTYHGNPIGFSCSATTWWTGLLDTIGTGNRFWVGSIDQSNGHVVAEALHGVELASLVPDIDESECFLLVGMDPAVQVQLDRGCPRPCQWPGCRCCGHWSPRPTCRWRLGSRDQRRCRGGKAVS